MGPRDAPVTPTNRVLLEWLDENKINAREDGIVEWLE